MFHNFFSSLTRSKYLSLFSFLWFARLTKSTIWQVLIFFLLFISRFGLLARIKWSFCISKSQRILCIWFSRTDSGLCIYYLVVWLNFNFLHNSQWITFPTQSCLVLYSFCAGLLHSLMWVFVSSLSLHKLHLLFCCVLSIFTLTLLVLMVSFCAAIRRDSVSLLKFPFLSYVQVFSCKIPKQKLLEISIQLFFFPFLFSILVVLLIFIFSVF